MVKSLRAKLGWIRPQLWIAVCEVRGVEDHRSGLDEHPGDVGVVAGDPAAEPTGTTA